MASALGLIHCAIAILLGTCADWPFRIPLVTAHSHAAETKDDSLLVLQQQSILATFKQQVVGDPYNVLASWQESQDVCSWNGVVCAADGSARVVALELPDQELHGTITPELFNLPFLERIDLANNSFHGSFPDIAQAGNGSAGASLVSLDLRENMLSGTLPASIGTLSELRALFLQVNDFEGPIPLALGRCNKLVALVLGTASDKKSRSHLNGTIPDTLANCSSLAWLHLYGTWLAGPIPEWLGSSVAKLQSLDLSYNQLTGTIPASLGNLTGLLELNLYENLGLQGEVPVQIGSCDQLLSLHLGNSLRDPSMHGRNGIAGTLGTLYDQVLSNMTSLQLLVITGTEITGAIPPDFATLGRLRILELWGNLLRGKIPPTMGNLSTLEHVVLAQNDFTGFIPREFSLCTRLRTFVVGRSSDLGCKLPVVWQSPIYVRNLDMVGSIPQEMGRLPYLTTFDVSDTSVGGEIPDFSNATALETLALVSNELEGTIAPEHLPASLQFLDVSYNRLRGPISPSFGNLSNLQTLRLQGNDLEGVIPGELGSCSALQNLELGVSSTSGNSAGKSMIKGCIPKEIGRLGKLRSLIVASTHVDGTIPSSLQNCSMMSEMVLNDNELSGSLPTWLSNMTNLGLLLVTTNRLSGPLSVVEWNKLESLQFLLLSRNNFSGHIPDSMGMAPRLSAFMASDTGLRGSLPLSFKNLSSLVLLDLQSNELSGNISDALDTLADTTDGRLMGAIILSSNRFGGILPYWIGTRFQNLIILVVAGNAIEGHLPQTMSYLPLLQQVADPRTYTLWRGKNTETDPPLKLTLKNRTTDFYNVPWSTSILDLSNNELEGVIPMELSHLAWLRYLNLSHNRLSGSIPSTLSNLSSGFVPQQFERPMRSGCECFMFTGTVTKSQASTQTGLGYNHNCTAFLSPGLV